MRVTTRPQAPFTSACLWILTAACCTAATVSCALFRPRPVKYEAFDLPSGVTILDLAVPEQGAIARAGDTVAIDFDAYLENGDLIDSTAKRGRPARFTIGAGTVPAGVEQGVVGMRLFGQRRIIVPPQEAFGDKGQPPRIPPGATLRFEVELMELDSPVPSE